MTNVYNKFYLLPNGTLIGNWYEEQCLRNDLNQLQQQQQQQQNNNNNNNNSINNNNLYKSFLQNKNNNTNNNNNNNITKNTFIRTFGDRSEQIDYTTTNDSYGNFPTNQRYYLTPHQKSFTYSNIINNNTQNLNKSSSYSYINNIKLNNNNNNNNKNIILDKNFYNSQNYNEINSFEKSNIQIKDSYGGKIIEVCIKKGWLGLRNLKRFLSSFSINKSNFIDINNIQFYFINYGINLLKEDLYFIFDNFSDKKSIVDYLSLLN